MPLKPKVRKFEEWYFGSFACSRSPSSIIISSENKTFQGKFQRIFEVAKTLIENPKDDIQDIRKKVAIDYFISMRCALDYINYAKIILEEFDEKV